MKYYIVWFKADMIILEIDSFDTQEARDTVALPCMRGEVPFDRYYRGCVTCQVFNSVD